MSDDWGTDILLANMDEKSLATSPDAPGANSPDGSSSQRRNRAREVLLKQRAKLEHFENALTEGIEKIAAEISSQVAQTGNSPAATEAEPTPTRPSSSAESEQALEQARELATRVAEVERLRGELEQARIDIARLEQEVRVQQACLNDLRGQQDERRGDLATSNEQLAESKAQLAAVRKLQEELRQELTIAREQLAAEREATRGHRRRTAKTLKSQRAKRQAERLASQAERAAGQAQRENNQTQLDASKSELAANLAEVAHWREIAAQAQAENHRLSEAASQAPPPSNESNREVERLRQERMDLARQLATAKEKIAELEHAGEGDSHKKHDFQRRYEMAVEDVRELKRTIAELESRQAKRGSSSGAGGGGDGGALDWEAQKRRLLASLEADDSDDEDSVEERRSIEATIRITDEIVAQKDLEIAELKSRLETFTSPGAQAVADLLDRDDLVRQERERLQLVEAEWRDKIGKAEIDISVERAKIARERAELEEKMRQYLAEQVQQTPPGATPIELARPARGRWLARLGLKELDEKKAD